MVLTPRVWIATSFFGGLVVDVTCVRGTNVEIFGRYYEPALLSMSSGPE